MTSPYRLSIIPAGAVTDRALEARDLQVLCLLGRHTDKQGWCFRSQVKMAQELDCGRSSIQRSLDRLYSAGWVEKRLRNMGATEADPKHPHTAHAYRVKLDRDDLPDELITPDEPDDGCPSVGTPDSGQGGAQPSVGTGCPPMDGHPINEPLEQPQAEQDSEKESAGAREKSEARRKLRRECLKRYPTAAVDSHATFDREWDKLPDDEMQAAIDGIPAFVAELKRTKRTYTPSIATYIAGRKWVDLPPIPEAEKASPIVTFPVWSREWWAMVFARTDRGESITFQVNHAKERGARDVSEKSERMPSAEQISTLRPVPVDSPWLMPWRRWFDARGAKLPYWHDRVWVFLPGPEPPVSGSKVFGSIGPPSQPLMTEADKEELANLR